MKTIHLFIIFIIVVLIQLLIPIQMIFNQESILADGTAYRFRTQPIDPTDPFKGKYITLNYEISSMTTTDSLWITNEEIYVYLKEDSLGFAEIEKISKQQLENDRDYVIAEVGWYNAYSHQLNIDLPFDRFYMEESKAKPAEVAFTKAQRDSLPNNTYALVYVKDGEAVLDNVFINDVPIAKYVEE